MNNLKYPKEFRDDVLTLKDQYLYITCDWDMIPPELFEKEIDTFFELKKEFLKKYHDDDPNFEIRRIRKIIETRLKYNRPIFKARIKIK